MKAQLKDGYKVEIDEDSLNDWEFIKLTKAIPA